MTVWQREAGTTGWSTLEVVGPGYSQLEVAPDKQTPEVVGPNYSQLEVAPDKQTPEVAYEQVGKEVWQAEQQSTAFIDPASTYNDDNLTQSPSTALTDNAHAEKGLLRRRRTWILLCIILIVILGVVLGVVFGVVLRQQGNATTTSSSSPDEDSRGGNSDTTPSPETSALSTVPRCASSFCPQSLNGLVESYTTVDQTPTIHLLARDQKGDIQHVASASGGTSFPNKWRSYGASGYYPDTLASTFLSIKGRYSISFFGVVSGSTNITHDHVAYQTIDIANGSASNPIYLGEGRLIAQSAPAVCAPANSGMSGSPPTDMSVFNKAGFTNENDGGMWWRFSHGTPGTFFPHYVHQVNDLGYSTMPDAPPGIACRDGPGARYDIVAYSNATDDFNAYHKWFHFTNDKWSDWHKIGGPFKLGSRPILVEASKDRFDFFGVGADDAIHHFTFQQQGEKYSDLQSLGGSFASNAAGVAMGADGDRIDVVAINKGDGKLKRKALVGTKWDEKWADLGVTASSVPRLMRIADDKLVISIVAADKTVWFSEVRILDDGSWSELKWHLIEGMQVE
ncbi:hypothetical protein MCOR25_007067 [Pyricularia grisea]|nr:hypothetical protein MCOR25_007067 [Pyricularia grisea]